MIAGGGNKLPFGNLPRLILAWVSTEAVRTHRRELILGKSLSDFMRSLGVYSSSGGKHTRLRNQMKRLFNAHVQLIYKDVRGEANMSNLDFYVYINGRRSKDLPEFYQIADAYY